MSLHAIVTAHEEGYAENMYLDATTRTKVEETGGANFIFVTKDGKVVTRNQTVSFHLLQDVLFFMWQNIILDLRQKKEKYILMK